MRKFMLMLLMGAMFVGVSYADTIPTPANEGAIVQDLVKGGPLDTGVRIYARVRNSDKGADNDAIAVGEAVIWDNVSDDGYSVTNVFASADGGFAGIAVTAIQTDDTGGTSDTGGRNWGYIQIYGIGSASATAGGTNGAGVGVAFITSGDDGKITGPAVADVNSGLVIGRRGGYFLDAADTTSTSYDVFIKAM